MDWRDSIVHQLQRRKATEQAPFEEISSYAFNMLEKNDILQREQIQLNLECEQLRQQLLGIQQTLLAGGSVAAKSILSKLPSNDENSDLSSNTSATPKAINLQQASLLAEKSQLQKKITDLQDQLSDALKSKTETVQKIFDMKTELEDKDRLNRQLMDELAQKDNQIKTLRESLEKLEAKHRNLNDEHFALSYCNKVLEKEHQKLQTRFDTLSQQLLDVQREKADRLNAENDKIFQMQQERTRKELEENVNKLTQAQTSKLAAGDKLAQTVANMANADSFEPLDADEDLRALNNPSRIPGGVEFHFEGHDGESGAVHWYCCSGPTDDYLATGGGDRKVKIWKICDSTESLVTTFLGSNASITSIDVEADAILASSNDFATRVWSLTNQKLCRTLTGHSAKVNSAKFLGAPNQVASGSQDRTIKIWDINPGSCFRTYFAGSNCYDLVYTDYQIISGHFDAKLRCWDLKKPNNNESTLQIALQSKITSIDVSRDGTKILCSLRDNTIKCLDTRRFEVVQTYSDEKFKIATDSSRVKFSPDGQLLACGSSDGSIYIWDTNTAKVEKVLNGHSSFVIACCWSPNGKRMASIDRGKKINIWL